MILHARIIARSRRRSTGGVATIALVALTAAAAVSGCGSTSQVPGGTHGTQRAAAAEAPTAAETSLTLVAEGQSAPYVHDGSVATLADVVAQYDRIRTLVLTVERQRELVEILKSF